MVRSASFLDWPVIENIQICVTTARDGKTLILSVSPDDTIRYVKSQIEAKIGMPSNVQQLTLSCEQLDESRRLSEYGINRGSTLLQLGPGCSGGRRLEVYPH